LRFLDLNKAGELSTGARVAVVGSSLAGNEGSARETTVTAQSSDRLEIAGATAASSVGSPVVNENGDVVGIVTSAGEKPLLVPVAALDSVLSRVTADTQARWPQMAGRVRHRTVRQNRDCSMRLRRHFRQANLCLGRREPAVSD